jgi:hypothetical protein
MHAAAHLQSGDTRAVCMSMLQSCAVCCCMQVLMRYLLDAVSHMHAHGISHRDLKLENLVLGHARDLRSVTIVDFGLAKAARARERMEGVTGTLWYTAPEILLGNAYSPVVDLWSLGVVLYLVLTGSPPTALLRSCCTPSCSLARPPPRAAGRGAVLRLHGTLACCAPCGCGALLCLYAPRCRSAAGRSRVLRCSRARAACCSCTLAVCCAAHAHSPRAAHAHSPSAALLTRTDTPQPRRRICLGRLWRGARQDDARAHRATPSLGRAFALTVRGAALQGSTRLRWPRTRCRSRRRTGRTSCRTATLAVAPPLLRPPRTTAPQRALPSGAAASARSFWKVRRQRAARAHLPAGSVREPQRQPRTHACAHTARASTRIPPNLRETVLRRM